MNKFTKKLLTIFILMSSVILPGVTQAWNTEALYLGALRFEKSGSIRFTLKETLELPDEFQCGTGPQSQWLYIRRCPLRNPACISAMDRMGEVLHQAKLMGWKVHVERNNCAVTEVALKPIP